MQPSPSFAHHQKHQEALTLLALCLVLHMHETNKSRSTTLNPNPEPYLLVPALVTAFGDLNLLSLSFGPIRVLLWSSNSIGEVWDKEIFLLRKWLEKVDNGPLIYLQAGVGTQLLLLKNKRA